jgi:hypothetical protein
MRLPNSMEKSPSWEGIRFSASHEIPRILRNTKVYYRIHNSPTLVPILNQDKSSPCPPPSVPLLKDSFQYYPLIYACVFYVVSFLTSPFPIRATCPSHLIILGFIIRIILHRSIILKWMGGGRVDSFGSQQDQVADF